MKKNFLLLLALLAVNLSVVAGPRTFSQARSIAERQAASLGISIDKSAMSKAKSVNGIGSQEQTADYFVFPNGTDKGYTIVSGDDLMPDVVGYASHGTFDAGNMPESMAAFLDGYVAMVRAVQSGDESALAVLAERKALAAARQSAAVSPLLGDIKWNQTAPYNQMCPKYDGTNLSATGCVATAMAEVMAYWKYPAALQADIPAYTTSTYRIAVPAISKGQSYDWDNMLPTYTSGKYTQVQADAVARLMYHCGAAVKMNYGPESGAYVTSSRLAKYFGYDADMMDVSRSSFTLAEWTALIDNELAAKRPVLYGGQSSDGGHQFVCDGSDGNGLYHISWGWSGSQDGYFDITILNPQKGGTGSGNATDGYNQSCSMIIGIQPDNGKTDSPLADIPALVSYGNFTSGGMVTDITLTQATRTSSTGTFGLTLSQWWANQTDKSVTARVAFGISNGNGGYTIVSPQGAINNLAAMADNGSMRLVHTTFNVKYAFKEGTYALYALYSTDGGTTWRKCAYQNMRPYVLKVTSNSLELLGTQLTASVTTADTQYGGTAGTFSLAVTNSGDDEYMGLVKMYTATTTTMPGTVAASVYITVPAHTTVTRDVEIAPTGVGRFYVWAVDDSGATLVDAAEFSAEQSVAPSFTLTAVQTNATPGAYERDNAYCFSNKVVMPRVDDDYAEFSFSVRNDGSPYTARCILWRYNMLTGRGTGEYRTVKFAGNGGITRVTYQVSPDEVAGNRTIMGQLSICRSTASNDYFTLATGLPKVEYMLADDDSRCYRFDAVQPLVYVAGKPSAVAGVEANGACIVRGGVGEIVVLSGTSARLSVCGIDGVKVCDVQAEAGVEKRIAVQPGLYIVNGRKVVVR